MSTILCKNNVRLKGVTPALAWIFFILDSLARHAKLSYLPDNLVITAIYDGTHMEGSKHYTGEAIDIRTKNFKDVASKAKFRSELEAALNTHPLTAAQGVGNSFRVLFENPGTENEHLHVQVRKGQTFAGV